MVRLVTQVCKVVIILVLAFLVVAGGQRLLTEALRRGAAPDVGTPIEFTVAARLHAAGLIRSERSFVVRLRLTRSDLQPGTYELRTGMTVAEIARTLSGEATDPAPTPIGP